MHAITCPEDKVYIKLTKNSKLYAHEERVEIHGTNVYEESDTFENNSLLLGMVSELYAKQSI